MVGIIPARAGFTPVSIAAVGSSLDHPRSRGVYLPDRGGGRGGQGSSPLARGLPVRARPQRRDRGIIPARAGFTEVLGAGGVEGGRIIPARAGFTGCRHRPGQHRGDHPRSRGVYDHPQGRVHRRPGIIPARAGFTPPGPAATRRRGDHPRSRGVYDEDALTQTLAGGSSPLARGLLSVHSMRSCFARGLQGHADYWLGRFRIIPARAGFTEECGPRRPAGWDHPRSRGVYVDDFDLIVEHEGSSPLARGLRLGNPRPRTSPGIIPARAGFTSRPVGRADHRQDHPRSRGVYTSKRAPPKAWVGSSPLARGLRRQQHDCRPGQRIIPARAGFTTSSRRRSERRRDHPRSRGVYDETTGHGGSFPGSSPLARGLLAHIGRKAQG